MFPFLMLFQWPVVHKIDVAQFTCRHFSIWVIWATAFMFLQQFYFWKWKLSRFFVAAKSANKTFCGFDHTFLKYFRHVWLVVTGVWDVQNVSQLLSTVTQVRNRTNRLGIFCATPQVADLLELFVLRTLKDIFVGNWSIPLRGESPQAFWICKKYWTLVVQLDFVPKRCSIDAKINAPFQFVITWFVAFYFLEDSVGNREKRCDNRTDLHKWSSFPLESVGNQPCQLQCHEKTWSNFGKTKTWKESTWLRHRSSEFHLSSRNDGSSMMVSLKPQSFANVDSITLGVTIAPKFRICLLQCTYIQFNIEVTNIWTLFCEFPPPIFLLDKPLFCIKINSSHLKWAAPVKGLGYSSCEARLLVWNDAMAVSNKNNSAVVSPFNLFCRKERDSSQTFCGETGQYCLDSSSPTGPHEKRCASPFASCAVWWKRNYLHHVQIPTTPTWPGRHCLCRVSGLPGKWHNM